MLSHHRIRIMVPALLVAVTLMSACGQKPEASAPAKTETHSDAPAMRDPGIQVAVVPDADLLFLLDLDAMRNTGIMQAIKAKRENQGKTAPGQMNENDWATLKEITGLDEEDMLSVLFSTDLNAMDNDHTPLNNTIQQIHGACAIALAKPLSFQKVLACLQHMSGQTDGNKCKEIELAGRPVARVTPSSPKEPLVLATVSKTEKTLLIALDEAVMKEMLVRDNTGQSALPSPDLTRLGDKIETGAQMRLLLLANDAIRSAIGKRIDSLADPNPQQQQTQLGILTGFISPLRNTQNIVFGAHADDALDVKLALELGSPAEAQQCAQLLQSFIVPMLMKSFEKTDPQNTLQVDDSFDVINEESTLSFTLQLKQQDVENWQQPGTQAQQ